MEEQQILHMVDDNKRRQERIVERVKKEEDKKP
jgi:hypothetical protein